MAVKHRKIEGAEVRAADETLVIPFHDSIAKGTLRAIFLQASRYIPQAELHSHFYNE